MPEEDEMLSDMQSKAALPLIGVAILSATFHRICAQEPGRPTRPEMLVSTAWLDQHLNDHDLVVIYIGRDRSQFDSGHIPGSRFLRLDELVEQHKDSLNELPPIADLQATFENIGIGERSRVVLTDDAGGVLAARAWFTLDYLGRAGNAMLLDGGSQAWIAEARTTSNDERAFAPAEFRPYPNREILVSTAQMRQLSLGATMGASDYVLLDARPFADYTGVVNSESVPQAGHIAGSQSLYWKKLIRSDTNPRLLDTEQLRRQFVRAGALPGKTVVTYCRTGMQSSFTYFVAKYLGYQAAMYDGSVYEWVHSGANPLVTSSAEERPHKAHP
jgi:thiosulfate/3-mercaptopyruvate sulfurtransferase